VLRHLQLIRQLSTGTWQPGRIARDAVILSLLLAAIGIGMAIYLIFVR
jgi:putative membrane protein